MSDSGPAVDILARSAEPGGIARGYRAGLRTRLSLLLGLTLGLTFLTVFSLGAGSFELSPWEVVRALALGADGPEKTVVWSIRLPRIAAALATGFCLGLSGLATQSLLGNPLASPFTLGISHGAAFGAAFSIVCLGTGVVGESVSRTGSAGLLQLLGMYLVTVFAFMGAMTATVVILVLARLRRMAPESVILAGVALSSLFISGTILVQYFATETELASVVFWTFGDVARSNWPEIGLLSLAGVGALTFFLFKRWDLNALLAGDETAKGLGVGVERLRLAGMLLASLIAALATAFHGVIAFLGLLAPHIGRRLAGPDHRLLIPFSGLSGSFLLLAADTLGRLMIGSGTLPVGVLTSFMGAPLFLYLLLKGKRR